MSYEKSDYERECKEWEEKHGDKKRLFPIELPYFFK